MKTVGVIGASGAVGREIVRQLELRAFPLEELRLFASEKSLGKTLPFKSESILLEKLDFAALQDLDLAFFCAGSSVSREWIPKAKGFVIDSSSAFRSEFPLIIPEINAHAIGNSRAIASPNCTATVLLMTLFKLHRLFKAKRIVASTYQAASGGGAALLQHLEEETRAHLEGRPHPPLFPFPYAFNVYPHNSSLLPSGYVEEEMKLADETRKILEDPNIQVSATCVRVPVLRAHSISANVEFHRPFRIEEIYEALEGVEGLAVFEDRRLNRFATPAEAVGKNDIFCGRFRIDPSQPNTLEFWAVGDQLLKGAALNAVQIGELLLRG
jgi:aspartate-semialdehyde dehydrogenase